MNQVLSGRGEACLRVKARLIELVASKSKKVRMCDECLKATNESEGP